MHTCRTSRREHSPVPPVTQFRFTDTRQLLFADSEAGLPLPQSAITVRSALRRRARWRPWRGGKPAGWRSSRSKQVFDGSDRHSSPGGGRKAWIHGNQGVGLQLGDREVLGVAETVPAAPTGDFPCV